MLRALEVDPDPEKPLYIFSDSTYSIKCMRELIVSARLMRETDVIALQA